MLYITIIIFLETTPKNKPNKLSPGASNKKRKLTKTPKKEKKDEAKNVNEAEIVKNAEIENYTESKQEKEESIPSKTKLASDEDTKPKKTVKKKRARIIERLDSSDDEDHLPVNLNCSKIDNSLVKRFIFLIKFISLYIFVYI